MPKRQSDPFGFSKAIDKKALSKAMADKATRKKLESILSKVR